MASFTYDAENRLVTTASGATLTYDAMGRLYAVATTAATESYAYAGDQRIGEYDGSGTMTARYVFGAGEDNPLIWYDGSGTTAPRALQGDAQGSIVSVVDASGTILAYNSYDEYGIPGSGNLGRFGYTGQVWLPQLGLWYYKARMLSPTLGRFLQTDPIGYKDQMDLYAYVGNDPTNHQDSTGQQYQVGKIVEIRIKELEQKGYTREEATAIVESHVENGMIVASSILPLERLIGGLVKAFGVESRAFTFAISSSQFGAKAASHMEEFGLDVASAGDRATFKNIINSTVSDADRVVSGTFRGQGAGGARGPVRFFIKGGDVVVTKPGGEFVTMLKNGIENPSVRNALKRTSSQ